MTLMPSNSGPCQLADSAGGFRGRSIRPTPSAAGFFAASDKFPRGRGTIARVNRRYETYLLLAAPLHKAW